MAQERAGAATVISQEGELVELDHNGQSLTVPMRGFPPGYTLVPGGRVILFDEPTGPVARPLVRVVRAMPSGQLPEAGGVLEREGRRLELQEGTVLDEPQPGGEERASEDNEVWIVERAWDDTTDQVIAVRRSR